MIEQKLIQNNYIATRYGFSIERIVLHTYGGKGRSLYNWFNTNKVKVSAHYAIFLDGNGEQYVRDAHTAWHAGTKTTPTQPNNNFQSIGIEHQDDGNYNDSVRTDKLYEASAKLVADLCKRHGIPCVLLPESQKWGKGITIHRYYASKACPGGLDARRIVKRARQIIEGDKPDEYYRVFEGDKQLGAYKNKDNAFNKWYEHPDKWRATYQNKDITSQFKIMATKLEKQIAELQKELKLVKAEHLKAKKEIAQLKIELEKCKADGPSAECKKEVIVLRNRVKKLEEENKAFSESFFGKLYYIFDRK